MYPSWSTSCLYMFPILFSRSANKVNEAMRAKQKELLQVRTASLSTIFPFPKNTHSNDERLSTR